MAGDVGGVTMPVVVFWVIWVLKNLWVFLGLERPVLGKLLRGVRRRIRKI